MRIRPAQALLEKAARRHEVESWVYGSRPQEDRPRRVITLSRTYGAGGITIAHLVAKKLGLPLWDRQILDLLASESQGRLDSAMLETLDERSRGAVASFLSSLVGMPDDLTYVHVLYRAIQVIARNDAIILGRGAHLLLPDALHVLLKAPLGNRIERIMSLQHLTQFEARKEIERRDGERAEFLQELKKKFRSQVQSAADGLEYDLEINTGELGYDSAAELILVAARSRFGFAELLFSGAVAM